MSELPWHTMAILAVDAVIIADWAVRIGLSARVVARRLPVGTSLAWLSVLMMLPLFGAFIYLLFGELRLGHRRARRAIVLHPMYLAWLKRLDNRAWRPSDDSSIEAGLVRLGEGTIGIPALPGNRLELLSDVDEIFSRLIADIDTAKRTCHIEFYIWNAGGRADEVAEALMRAARRGVLCRVLIDAVGSRPLLRGELPQRLREAGIQLHAALPVGLLRFIISRADLRNHRKIVVIDGEIAYTGSLNLVDPRYFKQDAGVGQWVDAMARITGPAVEALAATFLEDWELETGEGIERLAATGDLRPLEQTGESAVQVLPSGPAVHHQAIETILLSTIYSARRELVLTTPYFVPNESLLSALMAAAQRGVDVRLIIPERIDSRLVRLAGQSQKGDLADAGVQVLLYRDGLLHTKSVTIDGRMSLFGSLNLDPRSLFLNFEITLATYDCAFTSNVRELQRTYETECVPFDAVAWRARRWHRRFASDAVRLLSPLL